MKPIAVIRYAGDTAHGLAKRFGTSTTPHDDDNGLCIRLRERGWRVLKHRPLGELDRGDKYDADSVADQVEHGGIGIITDFLANADPDDLHLWGTVESADMLALWESNPPEFYRRLGLTAWVIGKAGGTPILDHAGASDHPANAVWIGMVRAASGVEPVVEPWSKRAFGGQFCLERWHYAQSIDIIEPDSWTDHTPAIRWLSGHTLADGTLPWGGITSHWLRHVQSHGHTPAMNYEDIDLSVTAGEFLERVAGGAA